MNKNDALKIVSDTLKQAVEGNKCTFATKGARNEIFWANPDKGKLQQDWWLILNDASVCKLYVFFIPSNAISENELKYRNDSPNDIDFEIKYDGTSFVDTRSKVNLSRWRKITLSYSDEEVKNKINEEKKDIGFMQKIFFGAPGTGKSYKVNQFAREDSSLTFRTTFHPDYDYAQFVGSFKPRNVCEVQKLEFDDPGRLDVATLTKIADEFVKADDHGYVRLGMIYHKSFENFGKDKPKNIEDVCKNSGNGKKNEPEVSKGIFLGKFLEKTFTLKESKIVYEFIPQIFAKAYAAAWRDLSRPVYLVIEEINRGNCAQIFGDIFQLLDRDDEGCSRYEIEPDADFAQWLDDQKIEGMPEKLKLPPNFNILATMNTSDQSLFPMDSAFKRRFDWEYVPINYEHEKAKFFIEIGEKNYDWLDFLEKVNEDIYDVTESEDKQMGEFFVKPKEGSKIDMDMFLSKVMFYLWDSVYKDEPDKVNVFHFEWEFEKKKKCKVTFQRLFKDKACTVKILQHIMDENLKVKEFVADKPAE